MREGECVVAPLQETVATAFLPVVILEITQVFATSRPAFLFGLSLLLLLSLFRVEQHFHAIVVETLAFDHVKHVEFDFLPLLNIRHPEVEPLRVPLGVNVVLENKVVLCVRLLVDELEVARFEAGLEDESSVALIFWSVIVAGREARWVCASLFSFHAAALRINPDQPPQVASSDQLPKVIGIELLFAAVELLAKSRVNNRILLPILESSFVLEVKQMP